MNFDESPGQFWSRIHAGKSRKPLRTFRELAEELGLAAGQLRQAMATSKIPAPQPVMKAQGSVRNTWYDPTEVRKWWAQVKQKTKGAK